MYASHVLFEPVKIAGGDYFPQTPLDLAIPISELPPCRTVAEGPRMPVGAMGAFQHGFPTRAGVRSCDGRSRRRGCSCRTARTNIPFTGPALPLPTSDNST